MNSSLNWEYISQQLTEVTLLSTVVRLLLAVVLGGIVGLERRAKSRPAGFRTHILVCVGACLAMLTNQFVYENMSTLSDPTRLGAQVITGVGFLGVGTILVTGRHKIKGLTTAAGLWASACMGLAIGIGFYAGGIITGAVIFMALFTFGKLEDRLEAFSRQMELYVEVNSVKDMKGVREGIQAAGISIHETHFSQSPLVEGKVGLYFMMRLPKGMNKAQAVGVIEAVEGVRLTEEI
ncbi:MAG: MgtC/SapB family protein [Clostridiales Family XIII bacterium]|jgi:putative Mg2+ transporter-C (MgtC) family protein|nr:MgtC/SapB family protein [Clostridiales Family XIII bacterium]